MLALRHCKSRVLRHAIAAPITAKGAPTGRKNQGGRVEGMYGLPTGYPQARPQQKTRPGMVAGTGLEVCS